MTLRRLITALVIAHATAAAVSAQDLPQQVTPLGGGAGGEQFTRSCGTGRVLAGVRGRAGMLVDAIGILCRQVLADGTLGPPSASGTLAGGSGGTAFESVCPSSKPVVTGLRLGVGTYVNFGIVQCATWQPRTRTWGNSFTTLSAFGPYNPSNIGNEGVRLDCENRKQPAITLRGRAHSLVDALGLVCNEP